MLFSKTPRVRLLTGETPLARAAGLAHTLGRDDIYFKRDDVMELGMGGNKVRSLEFWLGDALAKKATVVFVAGLPESNLCRLTAAACARLALKCIIVHNGDEAEVKQNRVGNPLLNHILGTETLYCGKVDEYKRTDFVKERAAALAAAGEVPYIVGDPVVGAMGYVNAALELVSQAERMNIDLYDVFISASGGPTAAGLLYGLALFGKSFRLHLISAEYKREVFEDIVSGIFAGLCKALDLVPPAKPADMSVFYEDYLGEGYAKPTKGAIEASRLLAEKEGIFLELTYNAKVLHGMMDLMKRDIVRKERTAGFFVTGGGPALFAQGRYFE